MKLDLTHLEQCGVKSGFSIYVQLGLYHGNQPLTRDVLTSMKQISSSGTIMIKELVSFDKHVKDLPKVGGSHFQGLPTTHCTYIYIHMYDSICVLLTFKV